MHKAGFAIILCCALLGTARVAQALDYASVADPVTVLYDAPSSKARKLFVVSRYMPLEKVVSLKDWVKVRDSSGTLAWVARSALSDKRYVVVTVPLADVRQAPDSTSPLVLRARQQVALQWLESTGGGWLKVRHEDGAVGYVKATEVWGD
jgi:SH3-like domain-containing protein